MKRNSSEYCIKHFEVIDSTNSYARRASDELWKMAGSCSAVVVTADVQTAGRGQRGNVWLSAEKKNLLATIMVRPQSLMAASQFALSQVIALAVRSAMSFYGIEAQLKWPNDIYVGDRKLAGILVELDCSGTNVEQAVIGVGLNVNQDTFAPMENPPVSMKMLKGDNFDIDDVLAALLDTFSYYYAMLQRGEYLNLSADYKRFLMGYGKNMKYRSSDDEFEAVITDVCENGYLCLRCSCGKEKTFAFKEVELVI